MEHRTVNARDTGSSPVWGAKIMIEIYKNLYVGNDSDYLKISHREGWSALRPIKFGPGGHKSILRYPTQAAPKGPNYLVATSGKNHMALNMIDLDDPKYFDWGM